MKKIIVKAAGNGIVDDTKFIQDLIDSTDEGILEFDSDKTYVIDSLLIDKDNIALDFGRVNVKITGDGILFKGVDVDKMTPYGVIRGGRFKVNHNPFFTFDNNCKGDIGGDGVCIDFIILREYNNGY